MTDAELRVAAAAEGADASELEAAEPRRERTLLACPTCKRGLVLLGSGTIFAPEVRVSATCVRCERLDARYRATTEDEDDAERRA